MSMKRIFLIIDEFKMGGIELRVAFGYFEGNLGEESASAYPHYQKFRCLVPQTGNNKVLQSSFVQ